MISYSLPKDSNFFTVFYMGYTNYFTTFQDVNFFLEYYKYIPEYQRKYYEVVKQNHRKMILDIDKGFDIEYIYKIGSELYNIILNRCNVVPNIVYFNSSPSKYHIIVNNITFTRSGCLYIKNLLDPNNTICDPSIYKDVQMIRMEGSSKQNGYCKYIVGQNKISNDMYDNMITTPGKIFVGGEFYITPKIMPQEQTLVKIPQHFKIRKRTNSSILLDRLYPAFCHKCQRVHDKENAYMYMKGGDWVFVCFREGK